MTRRIAAALFAGALFFTVCGDDAPAEIVSQPFVTLDGSPRVPDDAGVITDYDSFDNTLTIDGERTYTVHEALQSFSSFDGATLPIAARVGQYVHAGTSGDTVQWVALIGSIRRIEGQPETVPYNAVIVDVTDTTATAQDGAMFTLGVPMPEFTGDPLPVTLIISVADDTVSQYIVT